MFANRRLFDSTKNVIDSSLKEKKRKNHLLDRAKNILDGPGRLAWIILNESKWRRRLRVHQWISIYSHTHVELYLTGTSLIV
jgi:hypothetical protein